MIIAFWSNIRGKSCVTSNLAGVSISIAISYSKKAVIFENHSNINNLENIFINHKRKLYIKEEADYCYHIGIDSIIKRIQSNFCDENMILDAAIRIIENSIYYLPQSTKGNIEVFKSDLYNAIENIIEISSKNFDITYIDTESDNNISTKFILEKADLIVVNFAQDLNILEHFFKNYKNLVSKSIFLIGNYNKNSKYNISNISRKFNINKNNIVGIPYNFKYKEALADGKAVEFIIRNYNCTSYDLNYEFICAIKKASNIIIKKFDNFIIEVF